MTEQHAYLYWVMIDCFAEKTKLQRQVLKAGGWRQLKFNGDDACKLLDIPSSWEKDEPKEVDPLVVPLEEEAARPTALTTVLPISSLRLSLYSA